jgi:hypothetical protein
MSIGPMGGIPAGAAGLPLAQSKGVEVDLAQQNLAAQQRQVYYSHRADVAAGIGETDGEDHETADRDADGRLSWTPAAETERKTKSVSPKSRDPLGQSGNLLDVTG